MMDTLDVKSDWWTSLEGGSSSGGEGGSESISEFSSWLEEESRRSTWSTMETNSVLASPLPPLPFSTTPSSTTTATTTTATTSSSAHHEHQPTFAPKGHSLVKSEESEQERIEMRKAQVRSSFLPSSLSSCPLSFSSSSSLVSPSPCAIPPISATKSIACSSTNSLSSAAAVVPSITATLASRLADTLLPSSHSSFSSSPCSSISSSTSTSSSSASASISHTMISSSTHSSTFSHPLSVHFLNPMDIFTTPTESPTPPHLSSPASPLSPAAFESVPEAGDLGCSPMRDYGSSSSSTNSSSCGVEMLDMLDAETLTGCSNGQTQKTPSKALINSKAAAVAADMGLITNADTHSGQAAMLACLQHHGPSCCCYYEAAKICQEEEGDGLWSPPLSPLINAKATLEPMAAVSISAAATAASTTATTTTATATTAANAGTRGRPAKRTKMLDFNEEAAATQVAKRAIGRPRIAKRTKSDVVVVPSASPVPTVPISTAASLPALNLGGTSLFASSINSTAGTASAPIFAAPTPMLPLLSSSATAFLASSAAVPKLASAEHHRNTERMRRQELRQGFLRLRGELNLASDAVEALVLSTALKTIRDLEAEGARLEQAMLHARTQVMVGLSA